MKKNKVSKTFIIFFCCLSLSSSAHAAFKESGWGVRPEGMGGAFVSVADDANTIAYNPAGTVLVKKREISFGYNRPFVKLNSDANLGQFYAAMAFSKNNHLGFGLGWASFTSPHLKENSLALNFAMNFGDIFGRVKRDFIVGANMKRMNKTFILDQRTVDDPVFSKGSEKNLYAFDLGVWSQPFPKTFPALAVGGVLKNLNQPDAGLASEDKVPVETAAGVAFRNQSYLFTFEYSRRSGAETFRGGTEFWFFEKKVGLRAGANSLNGGLGFGYKYKFQKISMNFDYAFIIPFFVQETGGTHRFAVAIHK